MEIHLTKLRDLQYDFPLIARILDVPNYMEVRNHWQMMKRLERNHDDEENSSTAEGDDGGINRQVYNELFEGTRLADGQTKAPQVLSL
jgi:hypothetical protein